MNRRRIALVAAVMLAPVAVMVASCTFPNLSFSDPDGGGLPGTDTGLNDGAAPGDASADGETGTPPLPPDVDPEGGIKEAGTVDVVVVDASGGCCDCDTDTYILDGGNGGACVTSASAPGSGDCDDAIGAINPGASFTLNSVWPATSHLPRYDWNCDGVVTKQLNHNLQCAGLLGLGCSGEGFQDDPGCGVEANYFKCTPTGFLNACETSSNGKNTQACR